MFLLIVVTFISCIDKSNQNDSVSKIENQIENESLSPSIYKIQYDPIAFIETEVIKEGDSIIVFGGDKEYLKTNFGFDSCSVKVSKIFFTKSTGQLAFLEIKNNVGISVYLAISLYYLDSKRGYKEAYLNLWNKIPSDAEIDEACKDLGFPMKNNYKPVDLNLGFVKLN